MSTAHWYVYRQFASTASRLFGRSRMTSGVTRTGNPWFAKSFTRTNLQLPPWRDLAWSRAYSRASRRLVGPGRYHDRHVWERIRIPAYGIGGLSTQLVPVPGPDWRDVSFVQQGAPAFDFRISLARPRTRRYYDAFGLASPGYEIIFARPPDYWRASGGKGGSGTPPESFRRRQDTKLQNFYNRHRAAFNRNFSRLTELGDFATAVYLGGGQILPTLSNLAFNEAVDYSYGARAHYLREHLYKNNWNLPVGIDTLRRILP